MQNTNLSQEHLTLVGLLKVILHDFHGVDLPVLPIPRCEKRTKCSTTNVFDLLKVIQINNHVRKLLLDHSHFPSDLFCVLPIDRLQIQCRRIALNGPAATIGCRASGLAAGMNNERFVCGNILLRLQLRGLRHSPCRQKDDGIAVLDALVAKPLVTDDPLAVPLPRDVKQAEVGRDRLPQPMRSSTQRVAAGPLVVVAVR